MPAIVHEGIGRLSLCVNVFSPVTPRMQPTRVTLIAELSGEFLKGLLKEFFCLGLGGQVHKLTFLHSSLKTSSQNSTQNREPP